MGSFFDILNADYEPSEDYSLTAEDVREIRRLYALGSVRQVDLADEYGVTQPTISRIVNRKRRKGVE